MLVLFELTLISKLNFNLFELKLKLNFDSNFNLNFDKNLSFLNPKINFLRIRET